MSRLQLSGKRFERYEEAKNTLSKAELKTVKDQLLKLERQAQKARARKKLIRDLKQGQAAMEQDDQKMMEQQEEKLMKIVEKQNKLLEKQEKEISRQQKRELRQLRKPKKEFKVVMFANFNIKTPTKDVRNIREAIGEFTYRQGEKLANILKQKFDEFKEQYGSGDDYYSRVIKSLSGFDHEVSAVAKQEVNIPIQKVPMKNAVTLHREWLKYAEGIHQKSFEDMNGQCVYELLVEHWTSKRWPTLTKQVLFDLFDNYVQSQGAEYLKNEPFNGRFTMESGVNADMLLHVCHKKNISLYGFDSKENCFVKFLSDTRNHKPVAFYCADQHMYLLTDPKVIASIAAAQKAEKNMVVSSMLEMDRKEEQKEIAYMEASSFAEAMEVSNGIVYLRQQEITNEIHEYIRQTQHLPLLTSHHHRIVEARFKEKKLTVICDPNTTDGYTWRQIKQICDKAGVPFKNQRIGGLIAALRKKFYQPERRVLTEEEKKTICEEQNMKCAKCGKEMKTKNDENNDEEQKPQQKKQKKQKSFEFDHIQPLANGGSNELENFQALCENCHLQKTMAERENGDFIKFDTIASTFNGESLKIIKSQLFRQWAFVEKLNTKIEKAPNPDEKKKKKKTQKNTLDSYMGVEAKPEAPIQAIYKLDHTKCRRNLVMYGKYDYPMYSVMDYPTVYEGGDIKTGCYFVETTNYFPFRGNGWYPHPMVAEALEMGIINTNNISHQFLSSFSIKHDYFKQFAEYLIDLTKPAGLDKLVVNSLVGCWGIQNTELEHIEMTLCKYKASEELARDGVFVSSRNLNESTTLYSIVEKKTVNKDDMTLPIYNQIIAMEAMELYKLEKIIKFFGGKPMERNTDAILYTGPHINIDGYFWDDEQTVPKYRYDEINLLQKDSVCRFRRSEQFKPAEFAWNEINETDDFDALAQQIYESGQGCQINGLAGAGKTTLANKVIGLIESNDKKVIKLAPTRKASSHIGGKTLHKYYMELLTSKNSKEKVIFRKLLQVDYIMVDEISMVKEIFYRFLTILRRYAPHVKFVIVGDFHQLPPVNDVYQGDYRNSPALHNLCDGNRLVLEKCRRSDEKLFKVYDGVRRGGMLDVSKFPLQVLTPLNIAYTHETRKRINQCCMENFRGDKAFLTCSKWERNDKTQDVKLFEGMPIVSYKNDEKLDIYNSEIFTIQSIDVENNSFTIKTKEQELEFKVTDFKFYFYPAFCITVHTSQGITISDKYTIWDWNHPSMSKSARYVALSRATKYENIQIRK